MSAGIFGWDPHEVAAIATTTVHHSPHLEALDLVRFVLFNDVLHRAFVEALGSVASR